MSKPMDRNDQLVAGVIDREARESMADFEADAARKDLNRCAPTFADAYGLDELEADLSRELLSLDSLPPWPGQEAPTGHGLGDRLNHLLGGGVCPGYMLAVGAAHAGAGKTAFVMQLADGLALRTAELLTQPAGECPAPLTPVLVLSEMGCNALTWRTLARWTGVDSRAFRAGRSAHPDWAGDKNPAREALEAFGGPLGEARKLMRVVNPAAVKASGKGLVDRVAALLTSWCAELKKSGDGDREVWPVVVVDPIQRWQETTKGEVEALNELVESLRDAAQEGKWVALLTSDTNKHSAAGGGESRPAPNSREAGTAVFRGSYKLLHLVDAALYLHPREEGRDKPPWTAISATVIKNRWGTAAQSGQTTGGKATANYRWNVTTACFEPK